MKLVRIVAVFALALPVVGQFPADSTFAQGQTHEAPDREV